METMQQLLFPLQNFVAHFTLRDGETNRMVTVKVYTDSFDTSQLNMSLKL